MKRTAVMLAALLALGSAPSGADSVSTPLGYAINVPDNWISLSGAEVRDNPDLFKGLEMLNANPQLREIVRQQLDSGNADFYFRQSKGSAAFADNVNVIKQIQGLPQRQAELTELCAVLPTELGKAFGRRVASQACEFRTISDKKAVYLEFDGIVEGTRSMQYQVPRSKSITLIVTATCSMETLSEVRKEFEKMMSTFQVK